MAFNYDIIENDFTFSPEDTVYFSSEDLQFTVMAWQNSFDFYFWFDPSDYGWEQCTIIGFDYQVAPVSELYRLNYFVTGESIPVMEGFVDSHRLDSIAYYERLDERFIDPIENIASPVYISGHYHAQSFPVFPGRTDTTNPGLMDVDSFAVTLYLSNITVGIDDDVSRPSELIFHPPSPNPFNGSTKFEFSLTGSR